ncbi:hypothetical protein CROQUDRAFT_660125 [Cronartium quercuum f. sp. fusiforme G11]|uniref:B-block binding subunit of TFIIIC domain-containing protein n=1 Tax=Cronartium quercuum f. sp. fusiforme G11 TaxID=708437 RepID=A0A9P6NCT3_9BASI|nr:hypothetical protein CROQUDRAFT_660125 [Cronartium quercuum f. sp. fusiforme G11]
MAMDGEEGCSVARLDGFIDTYHSQRLEQIQSDPPQLVDIAYKNFVWKKLCELDQVRIGVIGIKNVQNVEQFDLENNNQHFSLIQDDPDQNVNEEDIISNEINSSIGTSQQQQQQHPLDLPAVVSNANNLMIQRKTRPSLSSSKRTMIEKKSNKSQPIILPTLSIGQQRAIQTGKVPKDRLTNQTEQININSSKRSHKDSKPKISLSLPEWNQLDLNEISGLSRTELLDKYGLDSNGQSRLRIAVDPMTCWRAVVGTDTRSPKLTPYVYQVLCIVAQGRESGATVIELGKKLKHDQKSLFHFVKVLTEMNLVTKFRAYQHKAWTNRVVHRRYLATSEWYQNFLKTDNPGNTSKSNKPDHHSFSNDLINHQSSLVGDFQLNLNQNIAEGSNSQTIGNIVDSLNDVDQIENNQNHSPLSPITKEHLAVNEPLIKSRIYTVLKRSPHHTMVHSEIIKAIGIAVPTKDERRRLNRHIDTYIKRGFLEKVAIVNIAGNAPCIRLTATGLSLMDDTPKPTITTNEEPSNEELDGELHVLPITKSLGQVIFELLTTAGQDGIIYKDLCRKLNELEIRTAEQILTRMERDHPPTHLSDLKIASVLETSGREKRVRWFSSEALRERCRASAIALPDGQDTETIDDHIGGFIEIHPVTVSQAFYNRNEDLYGMTIFDPKGVWGKKRSATNVISSGRPRKYPKGITPAERRSLKKKEVEGVDISKECANAEASLGENSSKTTKAVTKSQARSLKRKAAEPPSRGRSKKIPKRTTRPETKALLDKDEDITLTTQHDLPVVVNSSSSSPNPEISRVDDDFQPDLVTIETTPKAFLSGRTLRPRRKTVNYTDETANVPIDKGEGRFVKPKEVITINERISSVSDHDDADFVPNHSSDSARTASPEPVQAETVLPRCTRPPTRLATTIPLRSNRKNLTSLNREQQLLEAIRYAGGISEKSNELAKAVRDLADPGQQDSVTNLMDSRTLNTTLHSLQSKGEIKMTTLLIPDAIGTPVRRPIVFLASISLDSPDMISWLEELRTRAKFLAEKTINAASKRASSTIGPVSSSMAKKAVKKTQTDLPSDEALQAAFKNQWRCIAQLYGFMMGRIARAQALHMFLLESFQQHKVQQISSNIFQHGDCRLFTCGFLFQDLTVEVFVKLVPIMAHSEEFETFRDTPGAMKKTMSQVSHSIRRLMKIGHQFSRQKVYQAVEILAQLKLLIPLSKTNEVTKYTRSAANGEKIYYEPCSMNFNVGLFCLANEANVYKFSQTPPTLPPLLAKWPLKDSDDGQWFWTELKRASLPDPEAPPVQENFELSSGGDDQIASSFPGSHKVVQLLSDQTKWHSDIQLSWSQREHAIRFDAQYKDPPLDLDKDLGELERIASILVTSPDALKKVILVSRKRFDKRSSNNKRKQRKKKEQIDENTKIENIKRLKLAQEEAAKVLAEKAKNALKQKEEDWNSIINRFKLKTNLKEIDQNVLNDLHILFTTPTKGINANQLESELLLWLKRNEEMTNDDTNEVDEILMNNDELELFKKQTKKLPLLPSIKAKLLKMKKQKKLPKKLRKVEPRKLPDRPLRYSAIATRAIQPQPNVEVGSRPPPAKIVPGKRIRVEWNDLMDEYLRDMVAIIRARAYATSASLLPWAIATKVFKGIKQAMLKNRLHKLERDPCEKIYIDLLTDAWTQLYFEKRGKVKELPDPSPTNPPMLNGTLALDYLRSNIDKAYLRTQATLPDEDAVSEVPLPHTIEELYKLYRIKQQSKPSDRWDPVWIPVNNVLREEIMMNEAFSMPTAFSTENTVQPNQPSHLVMRACEAIKLLTSTPIETYSEPVATRLLSRYQENSLIGATKHLHLQGVLTYGSRIHYRKRLPGRSYCYTDKFMNPPDNRVVQYKMDEAISQFREMFAATVEKPMTWSLFATDVETAAILHAFTDNRASFKIDILANRAKRWKAASLYRTRRLGDDALENDIKVIIHTSNPARPIEPFFTLPSPENHRELIQTTLREAGTKGLTTSALINILSPLMTQEEIGETVEYLIKTEPPSLYWVCEGKIYIISADYLINWGEKVNPMVNEPHLAYIIPRVWYDIFGVRVEHFWQISLDRIECLIHNFPGIPIRELKRLTQLHFNELERYDLLEELIKTGRITHSPPGKSLIKRWIRGFSEDRFWSIL